MNELIKRLERVIQTGAPDKDGMHPISAETVLEVVNGLSEHGTNLAEVGTDLISRAQAIDALWAERMKHDEEMERNLETCSFALRADNKARRNRVEEDIEIIRQLPSAQPDIVRCKGCKYAEYIDDVQTLWCTECGQGRTVAPNDFCSYAERRKDG